MGITTKSQLSSDASRFTKSFSLNEAITPSTSSVTIFLSHKHSDHKEFKEFKKVLLQLNVKIYVDWLDPNMPTKTQGETAVIIKEKIKENKKFILLATLDAIEAPWCNWELGFGDHEKYKSGDIALFPLIEDYADWDNTEYMQIYPTIERERGNRTNNHGKTIIEGYYVFQPSKGKRGREYKSLKEWLKE